MKTWIQKHKILSIALVPILILGVFVGQFVYANILTAGYCWNNNIGWVNMAGVDYNVGTRTFTGSASYYDGKYLSGIFSDGEIDFTTQSGTSLGLTLGTTADGNGNYPIIGQVFSEEIGGTFANHVVTDEVAINTGTNTITIKSTAALVAGSKFNSIRTTGTVSTAGGATLEFGYEDATGINKYVALSDLLSTDTVLYGIIF